MINPDPKRFKLKKLRGKGYVLIPLQVIRWRKKREKLLKAESIKNQVETLYKPAPEKPVEAPKIEKRVDVHTVTEILLKSPFSDPFYDFFGSEE